MSPLSPLFLSKKNHCLLLPSHGNGAILKMNVLHSGQPTEASIANGHSPGWVALAFCDLMFEGHHPPDVHYHSSMTLTSQAHDYSGQYHLGQVPQMAWTGKVRPGFKGLLRR